MSLRRATFNKKTLVIDGGVDRYDDIPGEGSAYTTLRYDGGSVHKNIGNQLPNVKTIHLTTKAYAANFDRECLKGVNHGDSDSVKIKNSRYDQGGMNKALCLNEWRGNGYGYL